GGNLDYAFDVPNGTYSVRLLFAETYAGAMAKGKRVFDVAIEGNVIAKDLDIFTQAGAGNRALAINATVTVSDGRMGLKFVRKVQNPTISGIEIITATATAPTPSQPVTTPEPVVTTPEPIVTPPPAPPAPTTPTNTTVVRINVGGGSFTDRAGNVWSADKYHTTSGSDVSTSSSSIANTSDDKLFQTGRYKDGANLDYAIAVPNGTYQMKLLFSENYSGTMAKGKRVFDVAVEGNVVVSKLDIYALAGGGNRALTITKTVTVTDGKLGLKLIRKVQNPIISGIELVAVK
ncbi:MAG TPA: malectin domain-containing carbohydrate-binding protein, partial [Candidatus Synoicihabitans sp.]|nr:malectin domain-containing carbohydrate-binding protein [Candidatus Synoicihabitans sp.]